MWKGEVGRDRVRGLIVGIILVGRIVA